MKALGQKGTLSETGVMSAKGPRAEGCGIWGWVSTLLCHLWGVPFPDLSCGPHEGL